LEGIYRISGDLGVVNDLQRDFGNDKVTYEEILKKLQDIEDIHTVTGLLKRYFNTLEEPVLGSDLAKELLNDPNVVPGIDQIMPFIKMLPKAHRSTLFVLFGHLLTLLKRKDDVQITEITKMGLKELAIVWAPGLVMGDMFKRYDPLVAASTAAKLSKPAIGVVSALLEKALRDKNAEFFKSGT